MKRVTGGYGTCGVKGIGSGGPTEMCWKDQCGLSKEDAMAWANYCGTNWCCDSCGSASYC